jgi:hypothetical protein
MMPVLPAGFVSFVANYSLLFSACLHVFTIRHIMIQRIFNQDSRWKTKERQSKFPLHDHGKIAKLVTDYGPVLVPELRMKKDTCPMHIFHSLFLGEKGWPGYTLAGVL